MKRLLIILVFLLIPSFCARNGNTGPKVEVGQIWLYSTGNPFKSHVDCNEVLDVKNGWVQYRDICTGWISSSTVKYFLIGSKLLTVSGGDVDLTVCECGLGEVIK